MQCFGQTNQAEVYSESDSDEECVSDVEVVGSSDEERKLHGLAIFNSQQRSLEDRWMLFSFVCLGSFSGWAGGSLPPAFVLALHPCDRFLPPFVSRLLLQAVVPTWCSNCGCRLFPRRCY